MKNDLFKKKIILLIKFYYNSAYFHLRIFNLLEYYMRQRYIISGVQLYLINE